MRRAVIDAAAAAFPAWRDTSLAKRTQILFAFRELLNERKGELAADHHQRARQGASPTPSARSAAARKSSNSPAVSRICSRAGSPRTPRPTSTCTPSASRSARSASSARSTSRPWCRCGSSRSRSPPATPWCSNPVEKDPQRGAVDGRTVGRGRPAARGLQRAARRQDRRRRTAHQPRDQVGQLRRLHPDRPVRVRHRHRGTASGSRPSAGPRTTR